VDLARSETPEDGGGRRPRAIGDPLRELGMGSGTAALLCVIPIAAYAHANLWDGRAWLALVATLSAGAALIVGAYRVFALGLLVGLELMASEWRPLWGWPQQVLVPLVVWAAVIWPVREIRAGQGWLRRGRFDLAMLGWSAVVVAVSSGALLAWYYSLHPDVSDLGRMMPRWDLPYLLLAGLAFALLNAAMEEVIWRGVMMTAVADAFGSLSIALVVQTMSFGMAHLHGFPRGWLGAGMAATYGLMLGLLRIYSGGMLAPFVAHVFADLTIFLILVGLVR
jgi:membrane protease YdiL (CAAX protease family)